MEKRYTLQDFSGFLAAGSGQTKRKSEAYLRALFDIIQKGLDEDQFVKVRGFGTFKVAQISERESVSVNTGERITLGSHARVIFQPDAKLKELVNRPFAHFATVTLEETTDFSIFEADNLPETAATAASATFSPDETADSGSVAPASGPEAATESLPDALSTVAGEPSAGTTTFVQEETPKPQSTRRASDHPAAPETALPFNVEDDFTLPKHPEAPIQPEPVFIHHNPSPETPESEDDGEEYEPDDPPKQSSRGKIVLSALALLLLSLSSYFVGYFRILCPDCDVRTPVSQPASPLRTGASGPTAGKPAASRPARPAAADSLRTDSLAARPENAAIASQTGETSEKMTDSAIREASKAYEQLPGGRYLIVGTAGTHTVAPGEGIYRIARKYYGKKECAAYIILYNHIENPDLIGVGTRIKLPRLEEPGC
ncbi:MAG: HU family DNA-binding protein [Prevotellaceae bacterium]|nr:HU family DNA-binding protein [Prevotellaceae bacterium]